MSLKQNTHFYSALWYSALWNYSAFYGTGGSPTYMRYTESNNAMVYLKANTTTLHMYATVYNNYIAELFSISNYFLKSSPKTLNSPDFFTTRANTPFPKFPP